MKMKASTTTITWKAWHYYGCFQHHSSLLNSSAFVMISRRHCRRLMTSTTGSTTTTAASQKRSSIPVSWLDLRGSGLSILERLLLEECVLRHDDNNRNWIIVGHHDANHHRYLRKMSTPLYVQHAAAAQTAQDDDDDDDHGYYNPSTAIVLGIGGKPEQLLNVDAVQRDGVVCIKRFSGGGTVVVDANCIWTTLIFQNNNNNNDNHQQTEQQSSSTTAATAAQLSLFPQPYPRDIMEWTSRCIFKPLFDRLQHQQQERQVASKNSAASDNMEIKSTLIMDTKSCGAVDNTGRVICIPSSITTSDNDTSLSSSSSRNEASSSSTLSSSFALRENDYVLNDNLKMGGNAQSIVKHGKWLHHTSFLWDYSLDNMQYLTLPQKRPAYRSDRTHDKFLVKLKNVYPSCTKHDFYTNLYQTLLVQQQQQHHDEKLNDHALPSSSSTSSNNMFQVEKVPLAQAMALVEKQGGMQNWFEGKASRTRVLMDLSKKSTTPT